MYGSLKKNPTLQICYLSLVISAFNSLSCSNNKILYQYFTVLQSIFLIPLSLPNSYSAAPFAVLLRLRMKYISPVSSHLLVAPHITSSTHKSSHVYIFKYFTFTLVHSLNICQWLLIFNFHLYTFSLLPLCWLPEFYL